MSRSADQVQRIVVTDDGMRSWALSEGVSPDVLKDRHRPGFVSALMWVAAGAPVAIASSVEFSAERSLIPPSEGSIFKLITFPPERNYIDSIGESEVREYFEEAGSPTACQYSPTAPHPYMQKTQTLDFCLVISGEITLVLDLDEVTLREGETAILRGVNHAWSNRSDAPTLIAFSIHDADTDRTR